MHGRPWSCSFRCMGACRHLCRPCSRDHGAVVGRFALRCVGAEAAVLVGSTRCALQGSGLKTNAASQVLFFFRMQRVCPTVVRSFATCVVRALRTTQAYPAGYEAAAAAQVRDIATKGDAVGDGSSLENPPEKLQETLCKGAEVLRLRPTLPCGDSHGVVEDHVWWRIQR